MNKQDVRWVQRLNKIINKNYINFKILPKDFLITKAI